MTVQEDSSLYDRLGGVYNIATVIDDLVDRVMADDRLNANPRVDEAHHRVLAAGFKYYVTEMATTARPCVNGPAGLVCQTGTSWHLPNCAVACCEA